MPPSSVRHITTDALYTTVSFFGSTVTVGRSPPPMRASGRGSTFPPPAPAALLTTSVQCSPPSVDLKNPTTPVVVFAGRPGVALGIVPATVAYNVRGLLGASAMFAWMML